MAYYARVEFEAAAERALLLFARVQVAREEVDECLQPQRREARAHRARRGGRAGGRAAGRPLRAAGAEEARAGGQRALASRGGAGAERAGAQSLSLGAWYSLEERQESSQSELASRSQLAAELQLAVRVTGTPPSGSILISPAYRIINAHRMTSTRHSYATTKYSYSYMHL